jgi:hypothetical protein
VPWTGIALNLVLRAIVVAVVVDALLNPDAPRYAGKGIGTRGLVLIPASLLIPLLHWLRPRHARYPVWTDDLYLSVFALDMGGNFLDLYDRYVWFDLIPHAHGTGAAGVVLSEVFRLPWLSGVGIAQLLHIGLEAQEYYSDVLFGLRNVRGTWDTVNDLLAGSVGSLVYWALAARFASRTARPRGERR